jgi:hypothetical protein
MSGKSAVVPNARRVFSRSAWKAGDLTCRDMHRGPAPTDAAKQVDS